MDTKPDFTPYTERQERFGGWFIKNLGSMQARVYEWTGGRVWNRFLGAPCAVLTTVGRKTGKQRKVPLLYMQDGERVVMVASKGGMSKAPIWYHNLRANPEATIQIGRNRRRMVAREATPEEEAELWPRLEAIYPGYAEYRARCEGVRHIPVLIFEPA